MNNAPTYLDLTVEEHLGYIERQYPLHEDQYEYVCKLRQKVETELKDLKDKADLSVTSLCEKLKLTRKSFEVSTIDSHIRYLASRKIEKFFLSIEEEVKTRLSTLKNPSLIQSIEELYNLLESYRNTPELRANAEVDITLFPKETFDTEIQAVKGLVNELQKIFKNDESTLQTLTEIESTIARYPEKLCNEFYMIYGTLLGILSNRDDREKFSEYGFFQTYQHKVSGLELFLHELEYQTRYLEELAKLSTDDVLNSMKINWIGAQEDCATLINFLIDNGYIKSSGGRNIYITKHFNFKGKTKDNIKFGGRNISAGKIYVTDKLTIPK